MITIDEFCKILDELYDEFDPRVFEGLNGGVIVEDRTEYHPEAENKDLVVLGAYKRDLLGKSILIYYGSFMELYGYMDTQDLKVEMRKTFRHEITHHLEYLAGENDLEIEDMKFIESYKEKE
ncbi:metallopeptidase family protein [Peptoniphilus catoniae]|uniref:metallopeptidase family protein n=1 Tax=Peptoniphilus catoniae TaxID=1660341 RepID=UPI001FE925C4|nr:metallopeptidase family protein [Peptoniphilus catoniae]